MCVPLKIALDLYRTGNEIVIDADISISEKQLDSTLFFVVSKHLVIDSITCCDVPCPYHIMEVDSPFVKLQGISVELPEAACRLRVCYHGRPTGKHTLVEGEVFAVNIYSAWYPSELSAGEAEYTVRFHGNSYTHMANATYDQDEKLWRYQPKDMDCNILAYRNPQVLENTRLALYYTGEPDPRAEMYFNAYMEAADFCQNLYGTERLDKSVLAILPHGRPDDGYCRKALIVLDGFFESEAAIRHLITHEIAHNWCRGADFTWEDWLNETTAEWTALLYELHCGNQQGFLEILEEKMRAAHTYPAIRTQNGSRPEGVHDKGTVLFYEIYRAYGSETIAGMLNIFDSLDEKNTQGFIEAVRVKLGSAVADMIECGLE